MNHRVFTLVALISVAALMDRTEAATRLALVGSDSSSGFEVMLDSATALLSKDTDLQILDRAEVGRVLREQELSLAGLVGAEHAVKAGQLLHADLFAVLEGTLTNGTSSPSLGLVVFDAKTGVRYADSALVASNVVSAASITADAVRAAIGKSHRKTEELHTVGLLLVRNADLPRQFDGLCDSVGLLLERELTASPGIAVLERRRLEQVNKERSVAPDAEGNRLLASLRVMQLDIGQDGAGLRATLALLRADGTETNRITASVPARDAADLAHLVAQKVEQLLKAPTDGIPANREVEAERFHREYLLLLQHRDYVVAVRPIDAALALAPEHQPWSMELALLLPYAAIEIIYPGGQIWGPRLPTQPASEDLDSCLAVGHRGADLLLDLSQEAARLAKPGEPVPEVLKNTYRDRLVLLLSKLVGVTTAAPAEAAEIASLAAKERTLRMEIVEPFLRRQSVSRSSFAAYSDSLGSLLMGSYPTGLPAEQRRQDDVLVLSRWVEVSHKLNPPDGGGNYRPIMSLDFFSRYPGDQVEEFRQTLELDQDPVVRLYARAGRVASLIHTTNTLPAEREFRIYAQNLLAHDEAAKQGPFRQHVWKAIKTAIEVLGDYSRMGPEYLEACRFAFAQRDIQPDLFYYGALYLDPLPDRRSDELEVVNGALKLVLQKPEAYPQSSGLHPVMDRSAFIEEMEKRREQLAREVAGTSNNIPAPSPWTGAQCLLDLATPINHFGWVFEPVVQDGQVFAAGLGFQEWGLPEDSLQLMKVPLEGGSPSFLGRAKITGIVWNNRWILGREPRYRLTNPGARLKVVRAACAGGGCYFAATASGVFIFPTDGSPVSRLCATNGLPSDEIQTVAFLDGKLYIGAGELQREGYIVSYEPITHELSVLASSRRSEHLSPFDDQPPFTVFGLVAEPARHRLLMAVGSLGLPPLDRRTISPTMGIWTYVPSAARFERIAPLFLQTLAPPYWWRPSWAGLMDPNTLAVMTQGFSTNVLFDLGLNRVLPVFSSSGAHVTTTDALWKRAVRGELGGSKTVSGPLFLREGWFYSAQPFERMSLADGRREPLPSPRADYEFAPTESLKLLEDGKHVLAADQFSIWLLELKPERATASVGAGSVTPSKP